MKKICLLLVMALMLFSSTFAQKATFDKIDPDLRSEMASRMGKDEMFDIIIVMAEEYDQTLMTRQVQYMDKSTRRAFVINELQNFAKSSQYDLMQLLEESEKNGTVSNLNAFWIYNGIGCSATREIIEKLSERKDIGIIEPDRVVSLPANEKPVQVKEQQRGLAWHVSQVHANQVWPKGYTGSGVVVAIIDTGVNYNHVDLADHMWNGGTSYPHHGYDFVNNDNDPMDDATSGHGTHCAGITAGDGTSGTQTGIAPDATIMALKVLGANGSGSNSGIQSAMQFAMTQNADVVSMSLGSSGSSGSASDRQIFVNMMNAGIVASIAAGNDGEYYSSSHLDPNYNTYYAVPKNIGSPGNCPPPWHNPDQTLTGGQSAVVTVGASNRNDRKSTFSSFGPVTWSGVSGYNDYKYTSGSSSSIGLIKPDIIAPGTDITSSSNTDNNGFNIMPGTSMATPCVSGMMALLLSANPNLTPAQIDELLETTAFPADYMVTKNNYTGAGRADALAAIEATLTQATKPTNLSLETCGGNVILNWTASIAPAGYCIYRDNEQVGATTSTSFTDENVGAGKHVYYVRANDNNGNQSVHSNALVCTIEPYATVPEELTIGWDGSHANLDWEASMVSNNLSEANLSFTEYETALGSNSSSAFYWGLKYLPEELRPYAGMSIDRVQVYISKTSIKYTLRIYRGTTYGNTTGTPVFSQEFTPSSTGWYSLNLSTPYALTDITNDLWITVGNAKISGSVISIGEYDGPNSNCFYLGDGAGVNNMCWTHLPDYGSDYNCAVCIKTHFTRTTTYTPTYNLYLDNNSLVDGLTATDYTSTPTLHSGKNTYYVTAKVGNNESCPSNEASVVVVDNTLVSINDIDIDQSLVYLLQPTGILTVNNISNTDPARLILEDGAQLIHNSTGVKATMKKGITPYSDNSNNDGWNFIASPVTEAVEPSTGNGLLNGNYDLYYYDEPVHYWRNYRNSTFNLVPMQGYLYATDASNNSLQMAGTLTPSNTPVATNTLSWSADKLKGFNLIGNPFACNASISGDFYVIDGNQVVLAETGKTIAPCEGVFVQATGANQTVTFSKAGISKGNEAEALLDLAVTDGKTVLDRIRVRQGEGQGMEKFRLDGTETTSLTLNCDKQDYAVVHMNGQASWPVQFKTVKNGVYTLRVESNSLNPEYLHLIDHLTGADIDLLQNPSYSFEAQPNDYASRFKLVFNPSDPTGEIGDGFVEGKSVVIDMTGRVVATKANTQLAPGVYILRTVDGNETHSQKIIIK